VLIKNIKIYSSPKEVPHSILKNTYASENYHKVVNYLNDAQKNKKLTLLNIDSKNLKLKGKYDVVFIDGDHSYEGVKNDIEKVLTPSTKYIIIHDYFQSEKLYKTYGVKKYVDEIVDRGICKIIDQTHIMVVLEYMGHDV
jgi:predicted O-methyltransferase YrrM